MSVAPGLGLRPGEIGLLIFEDRVIDADASYAIELERENKSSGRFFPEHHTHHFTFGGEQNPLLIIASIYRPTLAPQLPQSQEVRVKNVSISSGDMLSLAQFAWGIVSFLVKL
jgi:hypothetical protein